MNNLGCLGSLIYYLVLYVYLPIGLGELIEVIIKLFIENPDFWLDDISSGFVLFWWFLIWLYYQGKKVEGKK